MSLLLGLLLVADVGLHLEQITDLPLEETVRPLISDLALEIERRTDGAVIVHDPGLHPCARGEAGCLIQPDPSVDEVLCVRLVGGVRKILVLIDRVRVQPELVISSTRLELDLTRERWREPFWLAARTLFPESNGPSPSARVLSPPPAAPGMQTGHWIAVGAGGAAVATGALLILDGALLRGSLARGDTGASGPDFLSQASRSKVEWTLGGALLAAGVTAIGAAVFSAMVAPD
ncbi:MAG: hypothetical protein U1E65_28850 [Myxococcota bacterium]